MGFKIILLISIVLITALFTLQNAQPITLVIFGYNSLSLPLSLWVIVAVLAGILSSLIIQILSSSSPQRKSDYSDNQKPYNPPPKPKSSFKQPSEDKVFSPPSAGVNPPKYNKPVEEIDEDFDFDFDEDSTPQIPLNNQYHDNFAEYEQPENYPEEAKDNIELKEEILPLEKPSEVEPIILDKNTYSEEKIAENLEENIQQKEPINPVINEQDNVPSETFLKAREASLYSYKPREKTEIKPKSPKIKTPSSPPKNRSIEPSKSSDNRYREGGVYDAPYRVISPAYDDTSPVQDDEFFDDDEDWDF
ncbi:hypothetical protein ACN4EE_19515 [Geminocystis sp. CENA526]|uniref:hypothetical protein n=1 Tax=Geminocystis sp. CENA526 TaxID=1355871 RepID=UPI003D6F226E